MKNLFTLAMVLCLNWTPHMVFADVVFDGYYKVILNEKNHVGFAIQRYEFDKTKKQFTSTSYIQTNLLNSGTMESLKAVCDDKFVPISYKYTAQIGTNTKTIDARFEQEKKKGHKNSQLKMLATISDGKTPKKIQRLVPNGVFLSTFLPYIILQNGLSRDKKYNFQAIAEEEAVIAKGVTHIVSQNKVKGFDLFLAKFWFRDSGFESMIHKSGEIITTYSPVQKISTVLVKEPVDASKGLRFNPDTLKFIFGEVPTGKINLLYRGEKDQ